MLQKGGEKFSYLQCTYRELLGDNADMSEEELRILYDDSYKSLKRLAKIKLKKYANKHYEVAEYYCARFQKQQDEEIMKILFSEEISYGLMLRLVENEILTEFEITKLLKDKYNIEKDYEWYSEDFIGCGLDESTDIRIEDVLHICIGRIEKIIGTKI